MSTAVHISHFVVNRYPPVLASVYVLAFGVGGIGLFAGSLGNGFLPARYRCWG